MSKVHIDCSTGDVADVELTADDRAQQDTDSVAFGEIAQKQTTETTNRQTVEQRLTSALTNLRTFIDAPKPSTAAAQASAAYDAAKLLARIGVGMIRLHLRRLDATD